MVPEYFEGKLNRLVILFIATVILLCGNAFPDIQASIPPNLQRFIDKLKSRKDVLQGGAIAIVYKGHVTYKETFGNQKGETNPITSSTLFPLASVSKTVTSIAIALMVQQGHLSLNEKFKLPYLKYPVSLINILSHTTGYQFSGNTQIEQGMSRQKLLDTLKNQKPKSKPGRCYLYSNATFSLVEEVLNQKRLNLRKVIDNLKVTLKTNEIQIVPIDPKMEVAYPHSKKTVNGVEVIKQLPFPPYYTNTTPASAGVFASIDGMIEVFKLSFGYRPDLISAKILHCMHAPIISNRDLDRWNFIDWPIDRKTIESYYGLGWRILKAKPYPKKELIFHSGFINGCTSFIGFIPSEDIGIIILVNQTSVFPLNTGINFWGESLK